MGGLHIIFRSIPAICSYTLLVALCATFKSCYLSSYGPTNAAWTVQDELFSRPNRVDTSVQVFVALYIVLMHVLGCVFPLRVCWAMETTTRAINFHQTRPAHSRCRAKVEAELVEVEAQARDFVTHAILIPSYKEDIDTLQDTLNVLASHRAAKDQYDVFLAMEEKDPKAEAVAVSLISTFLHRFKDIQYTVHPTGLTGEAQGKSSNISWAAAHVGQKHGDQNSKQASLITVMDSDTHLLSDYFSTLAETYTKDSQASCSDALLYLPPIIFDRNAHKVPTLVRLGDILWTAAAVSCIYPGSSVCIPTSVYSIPLSFAERIGGWDSGPEAIGEDLHMYLKCFFSSRCELKATPIFSPASHCNVISAETGLRGKALNIQARSRQALRHLWGSLDSGYAIRQGLLLWWTRSSYDQSTAEWKKGTTPDLYYLYHRLFEAHFLPLHISLTMLASILFNMLLAHDALPWYLVLAFNVSSWLRAFGLFFTCCWMYLYEYYHHCCVNLREREMQRVGLLEQSMFSKRYGAFFWIDYMLFPIAGTLFGSVPALVAQTWHIWTDRLDYTVSSKPIRNQARSML